MVFYFTEGAWINFTYHNWKGEVGPRSAIVDRAFFGSTEFHPEPQWLIVGFDLDKNVSRTYAMKDMTDVKIAEE